MRLKISAFARTGCPNELMVCEHYNLDDETAWADGSDSYVRIAPPVIVDFSELPKEDVITSHVKNIDEKIDEIRADSTKKIEQLTQAKRDILQIEYIPAGEE